MSEKLKEELRFLINDYPCCKIHLSLKRWETDFLRFYRSQTNYNISKSSLYAQVTLFKDKKNYSFNVNNPTCEAVREKIDEALAIIDQLPPDPDFVDLEADLRKASEAPKDNNIEKLTLEQKIDILTQFAEAVKPFDSEIYGTFICNHEVTYLLNSNGVNKKTESSPFYLEIKAVSSKNEVTVLDCIGGEQIERLDVASMVKNLVEKVKTTQSELIDVDSGDYEVILAPRCVADLLSYYAWSGYSARCLDRKDTDLEGKIGQRLFPECFSLSDLPHHPDVVSSDYCSEGHLLEDLPIFERGVFKNFLVSNYFAHKLNMTENGNHADCLVMETGDTSLSDMIKGVKKGLYISSFHYINFINARQTSLTGLTRDGTFLIENGKLSKVVNNLRFTDKITDVISNITAIQDTATSIPSSGNYGNFSINATVMPHILVSKFHISSSTHTV